MIELCKNINYQLNRYKMSKIQRGDICKVPTNVIFNFIEDQEMHSTITIENQIDRIVSYKVIMYRLRSKQTSQEFI